VVSDSESEVTVIGSFREKLHDDMFNDKEQIKNSPRVVLIRFLVILLILFCELN
jgi:hypothetical protein